jgi:hypothetical protein
MSAMRVLNFAQIQRIIFTDRASLFPFSTLCHPQRHPQCHHAPELFKYTSANPTLSLGTTAAY